MKRIRAAIAALGLVLGLAMPGIAQEAVAPAAPPPTGAVITFETTMGTIEITLDPVGAPLTAAQFRGLVDRTYFDGAAVYRIEPGFVVQLGELDAKLEYRVPPLPTVKLETATNKHSRGAVAMAHGEDPDSGQATFYVDLSDNTGLGATEGAAPNTTGYAVFGHVTAGMEVVDAIAAVELAPEGGPFPGKLPKTPIVVTRARVTREGG
jgi:cyclophilin family peptidyl-prolyl cis-trans isomerase